MGDSTKKQTEVQTEIYKEKCCVGCPDSGKGCRLSCVKLKEETKDKTPRPVMDIARDAEKLFSTYEITKGELARVKELEERLQSGHMTVSVIGQFKRGKSTLVNAILGDKILPVGIVPVTAVVTSIKYGDKAATVRFNNGVIKEIQFDQMAMYINEQENNDNHLGVSQVEIYSPAPFLKSGITLVDTPGVGSVHQKNSDAAYAYVKESDAVVFMLSVDSPINQIEIDFLENAKEFAAKFYFAVNKVDIIDEEDLEDYLAYCRNLIAKLLSVSTDKVQLFPVSAKKGTGIQELKTAMEKDWGQATQAILEESAHLKMRDVVESALSQVSLYRTALSMPMEEFDEKFGQMDKEFSSIIRETKELSKDISGKAALEETHINDVKNRLSQKIMELFGIEYHYELSTVDYFRGNVGESGEDSIVSAVEGLCRQLRDVLNAIFMHKEENAYVVCRRINDLNRLVRKLVKLRQELAD